MTTIDIHPGESIQEAFSHLEPGDTLTFKPGIHYGRAIIPVDDVSIVGEPGAIVEGTEPLDLNWELATDSDGIASLAGTGTWRVPNAGQIWMLLDEAGNTIFRIDADYVGQIEPHWYYGMSAYSALAVPNDARPGQDYGADWWNGIEALSVYNRNNGYVYVRYRDGSRPGRLRWSGGHTDHREPPFPEGSVFYLEGRRNIIFHNLAIRGSVDGIAVVDCENVLVESCRFKSFDFAIGAYGTTTRLSVTRSEFESGLLGTNAFDPISKISTENPWPEARLVAYHQYSMNKFWHDESDSTHICGLKIRNLGYPMRVPKEIEFTHNHAWSCAFAVDMFGGDGVEIGHNHVHNMWDMAFQRMPGGGRNVTIHDNFVHEAGYCLMRWHAANQEAGINYVYNNRVSDLERVSDFVYLAKDPGAGGAAGPSALVMFFYHNSYSGGNTVFAMDGSMTEMAGLVCCNEYLSNAGNTSNSAAWPAEIGAVDYCAAGGHVQRASGPYPKEGARYGSNNLYYVAPAWPVDRIEEDFILPAGHACKASGVDISKPFTISGRQFPALPGFEPGYFTGAAPDRGWIPREGESEMSQITSPEAGSVLEGSTVTFTWTAVEGATDYWPEVSTMPDESGNIYSQSAGMELSATVENLPTDGSTIYARICWFSGNWQASPWQSYTAALEEPAPGPPRPQMVLVFVPALVPKNAILPIGNLEELRKLLQK